MMEYEVVEEIMYGLESGILFGMASVISKMGFLFLEQGFSPLLVPVCIAISISCSGTGFFYQTRGLKHGRAIVVSTCAAVASIVTGVLAGMIALGERLPTSLASYHGGCGLAHELEMGYPAISGAIQTAYKERCW
ncbi:hypothetical protein SAY87_023234 [Trapa incisa]|uniref:Uncharacterized protein n=1 Tax=Trapa incisa TaxID=236973 RepID=A0AAN7K942_9MYRT|nr:hypothetical protein SAY87_023234 [Trapa incisa]